MTRDDQFARAGVLPVWPFVYGQPTGPIPDDLVGAIIVAVGMPDLTDRPEGGGLVIDYKPATGSVKRIVLGFNEAGMDLVYEGPIA